jgi:predicted enzyme related to lactoylglutathione lyase
MANTLPHAASSNAQFSFSKRIVHDLDAMAAFYARVFGLVENNRHSDAIAGRPIREITYEPTSPGGGSLTLICFDDARGAANSESSQGFTTSDLAALVERALAAGGKLHDPIRRISEFDLQVAFVADPEGHLNEVVRARLG